MQLNRKKFFENAFGVIEGDYKESQLLFNNALIKTEGSLKLQFKNKPSLDVGSFSTPTLFESQKELEVLIKNFKKENFSGGSQVANFSGTNIVSDIGELHISSKGVFMVASQFNTLEHYNPNIGPNCGTKYYPGDYTQGPVCAMSAAAGLAYRNFCVPIKNGIVSTDTDAQLGQTDNNQINCLVDFQNLIIDKARKLKIISPDRRVNTESTNFSEILIPEGDFFAFKNGYIESTKKNLEQLNILLDKGGDEFKQELKNALRVGIHRDTEVTSSYNKKLVTQVYASAIGINYSELGRDVSESDRKKLWEPIAKIILEGAYEHTLLEGLKNNVKKILAGQQTEPILLTQLGGGAFGNDPQWIKDAMASAIEKAGSYGVPFDVKLVHFRTIDPVYQDGFLEKAVKNAKSVMTSTAPASRVSTLTTQSEVNTTFLKDNNHSEKVWHTIDDQGFNNYFLIFKSKQDAIKKSQELANHGIVGSGGNNKFVMKLGENSYYIILTDENVDKLKKIQANLNFLKEEKIHQDPEFGIDSLRQDNYNLIFKTHEDAIKKSQELANLGIVGKEGNNKFVQNRPLRNKTGTETEYFLTLTNDNIDKLTTFKKNFEFLQEKYKDKCFVIHELDKDKQNNYTLLFKEKVKAEEESRRLAGINIVGKAGSNKYVNDSHVQGSFIILTNDDVAKLKTPLLRSPSSPFAKPLLNPLERTP